jgi:hypothetical protein
MSLKGRPIPPLSRRHLLTAAFNIGAVVAAVVGLVALGFGTSVVSLWPALLIPIGMLVLLHGLTVLYSVR